VDERIKRLLREAHDPVSMAEVCAVMLNDPSYHPQIRSMLQPHVRRSPEAREVFLEVLPAGVNAFCIRCREAFELDENGFPRGRRASVPRKKRKLCTSCENDQSQQMGRIWGQTPFARQQRDVVAKAFSQMLYCGRCGTTNHLDHNCGRLKPARPDWITGKAADPSEPPTPPDGNPWVLWRDA
jgi:hypothetical protein